ncbi:MAG: hypothetical protein HPY67_01095 [Syntrophaceae bacterium]|nr:hypothetical protein [Syntrophaceae bacterium]
MFKIFTNKRHLLLPCVVMTSLLLAVTAVSATLLKSRLLPTDETLKSALGSEKFNALRFETYGGLTENRMIGYFLYRDGIRVKGDGPHIESIGKLSLNDVLADHERVARAKFYGRIGHVMIREVTRNGDVVGYTVNDPKMEITLWDVTTDAAAISLELRYKDLQPKGERYDAGPR